MPGACNDCGGSAIAQNPCPTCMPGVEATPAEPVAAEKEPEVTVIEEDADAATEDEPAGVEEAPAEDDSPEPAEAGAE